MGGMWRVLAAPGRGGRPRLCPGPGWLRLGQTVAALTLLDVVVAEDDGRGGGLQQLPKARTEMPQHRQDPLNLGGQSYGHVWYPEEPSRKAAPGPWGPLQEPPPRACGQRDRKDHGNVKFT